MLTNTVAAASQDLDLIVLEEVDSTNDELRRILLRENSQIPCSGKAVMAKKQTGGKGRLGRSWASPPGGLYLSCALDIADPSPEESALSLIGAMSVREALAKRAAKEAQHAIQIKWPNDVVCAQGKLVGILVELVHVPSLLAAPFDPPLASSSEQRVKQPSAQSSQAPPRQPAKKRMAIFGIGVNVTRPPRDASTAAAYLSDLCASDPSGALPSLEQLAREVLASLKRYYASWMGAGKRFALFQCEYNSHLATRAVAVAIRDNKGSILAEGTAQGVDAYGYLIVKDSVGKLERVGAGEVTLR